MRFLKAPGAQTPKIRTRRGKPDLAHLSGPLSQKRIFLKIEKLPKLVILKACGAQIPKIRTRREETGPGASFWTLISKTDFSENRKTPKPGFLKTLPEPKLRKSEPEGGKPTLPHLSGPLSPKRIFQDYFKDANNY